MEKSDLAAQLEELDHRANKRQKISKEERVVETEKYLIPVDQPMSQAVQKVYESSENGGTYHLVLKNTSSTKAGTTEGNSAEDRDSL